MVVPCTKDAPEALPQRSLDQILQLQKPESFNSLAPVVVGVVVFRFVQTDVVEEAATLSDGPLEFLPNRNDQNLIDVRFPFMNGTSMFRFL